MLQRERETLLRIVAPECRNRSGGRSGHVPHRPDHHLRRRFLRDCELSPSEALRGFADCRHRVARRCRPSLVRQCRRGTGPVRGGPVSKPSRSRFMSGPPATPPPVAVITRAGSQPPSPALASICARSTTKATSGPACATSSSCTNSLTPGSTPTSPTKPARPSSTASTSRVGTTTTTPTPPRHRDRR